jgi:hypothetical protein
MWQSYAQAKNPEEKNKTPWYPVEHHVETKAPKRQFPNAP